MGILFQNGTIVNASGSGRADLLVEGETIAHIGAGLRAAGHTVVDCSGMLLMPGGIDVHTHLNLPLAGTASNSDYDSGHIAAACGGTTSHIDFAIQPLGGTLAEGLRIWQDKARLARIDYGFHMTITDPRPEVLAEIPAMGAAGITTIKILMAYKHVFQVDDTGLFQTLKICAENGMLVMVHAENGDVEYLIRQELLANGHTEPCYHAASRPPEIEAEATNRAVMMAGLTGCPLYVVHMTNAGAVAALARGRQAGYPVMGETCTQYLVLTAEEHLCQGGWEGAKYVCSPPIRTESDHAALWTALAEGTLQVVSTDHCDFWFAGGTGPHAEWAAAHDDHHWPEYEAQDPAYRRPGKELGRGDFSKMPNGLPGIEDRLLVLWELGVNRGRITPEQFVALNATNPARIFGMAGKGALAPGYDADILVWDPAAEHTISAQTHHMHTDYNCYEGMVVRGKPAQVFSRGRLLVADDAWVGGTGGGRYIARQAGAEVL
jgi:dihydropyrimidinase